MGASSQVVNPVDGASSAALADPASQSETNLSAEPRAEARVLWHLIERDADGAALAESCQALKPALFRLRHLIEACSAGDLGTALRPAQQELIQRSLESLAVSAPSWPAALTTLLEDSGKPLKQTVGFLNCAQLYLEIKQPGGPPYSEQLLAAHLQLLAPAALAEIDQVLELHSTDPRLWLTPELLRSWVRTLGYDLELLHSNLAELTAAVDLQALHREVSTPEISPRLKARTIENFLLDQGSDPETAASFGVELSHLPKYELPRDLAFGRPTPAARGEEPAPLFFEEFPRCGAAVLLSVVSSVFWGAMSSLPQRDTGVLPLFPFTKLFPGEQTLELSGRFALSLASHLTGNPWLGFRLADLIRAAGEALPGMLIFGSLGWMAAKGLFGWLANTQRQKNQQLYQQVPETFYVRVPEQPFAKPTAGPKEIFSHPGAYALGALSIGTALWQGWALADVDFPRLTELYGPVTLLSGALVTTIVLMNEARLYRAVLQEYVKDLQRAARSAHSCRSSALRKVFSLNPHTERLALEALTDPPPLPPAPDSKFELPESARPASERERYLLSIDRAHFLAELISGEQRNRVLHQVLEYAFRDHEHSLGEVLGMIRSVQNAPGFSELTRSAADRVLTEEELRSLLDQAAVTAA